MTYADLAPWADRRGAFDPLRAAVFAGLLLPAAAALWRLWADRLIPEPEKAATHLTGEWTLYILLAALAVTPLRRLLGWGRLIGLRRMVGVAGYAYAAGHLGLYVLHENGNLAKVASEILSRIYLTIGFAAVLGLLALAATSFDRAIRRMGPWWRRLHKLAYPLTALGILHFFMQSKIDVSHPAVLAGVFSGLMLLRLRAVTRLPAAGAVAAAAVFGGLAAAGFEAAWHGAATGAPWRLVLESNLDFSYEVRPPWIAAAILAAPLLVLAGRTALAAAMGEGRRGPI